jgi:hypothetical protein
MRPVRLKSVSVLMPTRTSPTNHHGWPHLHHQYLTTKSPHSKPKLWQMTPQHPTHCCRCDCTALPKQHQASASTAVVGHLIWPQFTHHEVSRHQTI